jgi:hypothetical protein
MMTRFGQKNIFVGWAHHELIWVEAALTLDLAERRKAFHDIAALTTRSVDQVRGKARQLRDQKRRAAMAQRTVMRLPAHWQLGPSQLKQPTKLQLMGCR